MLTITLLLMVGSSVGWADAWPVRPVADSLEFQARDSIGVSAIGSGTVVGTVRNRETGAGVSGALITVGTSAESVRTDVTGSYVLRHVHTGASELRVVADGHDPLSVVVSVPSGETIRVDLVVTPKASTLPALHVVATLPPLSGISTERVHTDGMGMKSWLGNPSSALISMGEPDVLHTLVDDPSIMVRPEGAPTFLDRTSGGGRVSLLFDGLPVWSAVHATGASSVISPDVVAGTSFYGAAVPAQYGGRLGGVLDVHPLTTDGRTSREAVTFGSIASRAMAAQSWHWGSVGGDALVSARRSNDDVPAYRGLNQPESGHWSDGIAMFSATNGPTDLRVVALGSDDQFGSMSWMTQTVGMHWSQQFNPAIRLDTRAWWATFHDSVGVDALNLSSSLANTVQHVGVSTQVTSGATLLGASLERFATHYHVSEIAQSPSADSTTLTSPLDLHGAPTVAAVFGSRTWGDAGRPWSMQAGLRFAGLRFAGLRFAGSPSEAVWAEPRFSASRRVGDWITFMVGYMRAHQFVQSLRNANAPLGTVVGVDFPVAAGRGTVPVAQSDAITGRIVTRVGPSVHLTISGYARGLTGLISARPEDPKIFAGQQFDDLTERIAGGGVTLDGQAWNKRILWELNYGIAHLRFHSADTAWQDIAPLVQSGTGAFAVRVDQRTQLRVVGWFGRDALTAGLAPTSLGIGELSSGDGEGEDRELERDGGRSVPTGQAGQLVPPAYARLDVTATHGWLEDKRFGTLTTFFTVANILNRSNVVGYTTPQGATVTPQPIQLMPRSLLFGLTWRH